MDNTVYNHAEWGILVNDYPDTETPSPKSKAPCAGGQDLSTPAQPLCYYHAFGDEVRNNTLYDNGTLHNPGDAGLANVAVPNPPNSGNCYHGNTDPKLPANEPSSDPAAIQPVMGTCGVPGSSVLGALALAQLVCSSASAINSGPVPTPSSCPGRQRPPADHRQPAADSPRPGDHARPLRRGSGQPLVPPGCGRTWRVGCGGTGIATPDTGAGLAVPSAVLGASALGLA